jgi:phage shock protein A
MGPLLRELLIVLRVGVLWVGLPLLLAVVAIGPGRCWGAVKRGWKWLWRKRLEPEEVLGQVVKQYQDLVESLNQALEKSREAEHELQVHIKQSEDNLVRLEKAAAKAAADHDDLEAKAVLYRINLERSALGAFRGQLERQKKQIEDVRRHLYLGELQLRQYEVGRSILLSQLAEAKTAEQQYAIASQFDPFSAVASWKQAENMVEEKQLNARAAERVYADLMDVPLDTSQSAPPPTPVAPEALDEQLRQLKERLRQAQ